MSQRYRVRYLRLGDTTLHDEWIDGLDEFTVRAQLQAQGQTVLSVQAPRQPWTSHFKKWLGRTEKRYAFPLFCREIRTLLQAGMTVVEAVETLSARERLEGRMDSLSALVLARLQHGLSLSIALGELKQAPAVLIAAVRAGERTSNLIDAMDDYLRFDNLVTQLRKKVISAAIYPALVTLVGMVISLFLLLVVMPKFAAVYENLRGTSQGSAALTIQISQFVGQNRAILFFVLITGVLAVTWWVVSGKAKIHGEKIARAVPWIGRRIEDFQLAMMYQTLALLLKGGYPMTEAMGVASQSALSPQLKAGLSLALRRIEAGGSVSQALSEAQLCDEVDRRLMAASERNGQFHIAADVVSRLHGERFELFVERVTRIIEPLLLLAVAMVVGAIVVMMYLPVFDMATQLR
ncbi:MAG: Type II secretory pathway component PulF [Comamonadaceae bacterium]|nr:MAG: Type II secretory pathway component PulF [Comamonadaceae bacterium]